MDPIAVLALFNAYHDARDSLETDMGAATKLVFYYIEI